MEAKLTKAELGTQLCTQLSTVTENDDLFKAWHLLSVLLTFGHPVRPTELASRCTLFRSSPEFVEFLCSIPNSPLSLTENLFVTLSSVAYVAFGKFVSNLNAISAFLPGINIGLLELKRAWADAAKKYCKKRKRNGTEFEYLPVVKNGASLQNVDEEEEDQNVLAQSNGIQNTCAKVHFQVDISRNMITHLENSDKSNKVMFTTSSLIESSGSLLSYGLNNAGQESQREIDVFVNREELGCASISKCQFSLLNHDPHVPDTKTAEGIEADMSHREASLLPSRMEHPVVLEEAKMNKPYSICGRNLNEPYCPDLDEQMIISPVEADNTLYTCKAIGKSGEDERVREGVEKEQISNSDRCKGDVEDLPINTTNMDMPREDDFKRNIILRSNETLRSLGRERRTTLVENQAILSAELLSVDKKQVSKSLSKLKTIQQDAQNNRLQVLRDCETIENYKASGALIEQQQCERDKRPISMKQKLKQNHEHHRHTDDKGENSKEIRGKPVSPHLKNQVEAKLLPNFESFTVEEEEGSGGYGTVYRAKRKRDGVTLAIKCPHDNANRHHIQNEMKMLERFGGKNFVIKYEGSFKYGSADCLVLEHVEHDRPEVLKREIDVFQLQWYGYCLFRALAGLHKQGVVHRDVKPGNFLFSRKLNKGYLIDFNLAMDLHQKYGTTDKSAMSYDMGFNHIPVSHPKSLPPAKSRKFSTAKALEAINQEAGKGSKSLSLPKNLKMKTNQAKEDANLSTRNIIKSQGADGSGITSAKDATSTRIPSAERLREPMPCQGRKELISLAQEAMKGPNHEVASSPASKRKRISALPERVNRKLVYLTPMPLHSTGVAVAGAGLLKSKGESKHKREGPCVGTKGFRAPESLFRSIYQGPKVDIWSAGVTLVYLITGRSPFVGDPDQNIKDIAKFRGSEDLWEVAKLHNRESSFPVQLFDKQHLPSKKLRDWCGLNTRRSDFLEVVPRSFFDLLDKCLTVNPRLRISAEEALRHEFFAPCHEQLRKQRLLRQGLTCATLLLNTQPQICQGL